MNKKSLIGFLKTVGAACLIGVALGGVILALIIGFLFGQVFLALGIFILSIVVLGAGSLVVGTDVSADKRNGALRKGGS